jgi:hypothetical protein
VTAIHCSECGSPVLDEEFNAPEFRECSGCGSLIRVRIFPAYYRTGAPAKAESVIEGESSCFFHPKKQAVAPCDECGRFLCALCRVEFGSRNICPGCIDSGMRKGKLPVLETTRRRYDSIALGVATLPLVLIWPTLISAPVAIYLCIRHWKDPIGILPRSRWRFIAALVFAIVQIGSWAAILLFLIAYRSRLFV